VIGDAARVAVAPRRTVLMPRTVAGRELAIVLSRPRALAIKAGLPLLLALVLVAGHAPTFWAGMLLTVLVAMVGAVGTAVSVSRARDAGFLTRLAATPGSRPRLLAGWVLAAAAVDVVQLLPVAIAAGISGGGGPAAVGVLVVALAGAGHHSCSRMRRLRGSSSARATSAAARTAATSTMPS
jgi:hypothetical protein